MAKEYAEIIKQLKDTFPKGTVKNARFIPNQVYVDRLEVAAESRWDKEIRQLDVRPDLGYVKAIVRVIIGEHYREGAGFESLPAGCSGDVLKTAVDKALASAFVSAVDEWQVGWIDLCTESKRDWADNPGITLLQNNPSKQKQSLSRASSVSEMIPRVCVTCKNGLTEVDKSMLKKIPGQNIDYCNKCLPEHRRRKIRT
ncbi:hypothetical protein SAMN04487897_1693 [Paenibacillus sp. yr247]|uniref:hypothetical protein n=1 Tax=Paenibacillus sp. yr247 TaxID=1761880 RepID=UPI000890C0CE|nr:hypothetical protein [Paenibacillus sp. yr247]SDP29689.1 hypothetical protein SAMN04487897_1693 [Paenibacillus sp. yr247]